MENLGLISCGDWACVRMSCPLSRFSGPQSVHEERAPESAQMSRGEGLEEAHADLKPGHAACGQFPERYERCGRNGRRQGRCGERRWIGAHAQMSAEHPFVDLSSAVGSRGQKTQDEESIPLEMAEHKRPDQNVDEREQEVLCLLPGGHLRLLRMRPGLFLPRALPETDPSLNIIRSSRY